MNSTTEAKEKILVSLIKQVFIKTNHLDDVYLAGKFEDIETMHKLALELWTIQDNSIWGLGYEALPFNLHLGFNSPTIYTFELGDVKIPMVNLWFDKMDLPEWLFDF